MGDVYLGKVKKIVPSLNAAFVDVGYEKDAFLHYLDLGPQYRSMSKFVQASISGKQSTHKLGYNKIEADILKDGKIKEHENDYGTQTAKALVYNAWWFEAIMAFFIVNFFGNIFRYRLLRKEKWPVLLFHVSFLLILIGAGVTRYVGYEGLMLIKKI